MKVTKVYKEDGCILVKVAGWNEPLKLENHVGNRRFMDQFEKYQKSTPALALGPGCTVGELKSIGYQLKDYDGYHFLEKSCTIEVIAFKEKALRWKESRKGNFWTPINCNVHKTGLTNYFTRDVHALLHKKSYDKNPNILEGETYNGVCKARVYGYGDVIEDDFKLNYVNYTIFIEDPKSELAKNAYEEAKFKKWINQKLIKSKSK